MKTIIELNESDFDRTLAAASTPVVVDFFAPWCGPCKMLTPILAQLAELFAGRIQFCKVDVEEAPDVAARYGITSVPTLLFFKGGKLSDTVVGLVSPRELATKLGALAPGRTEVRA